MKKGLPPIFLVIGAQKSGTTTLYRIFEQHPEVATTLKKESKFFCEIERYNKGLSFYQNLFPVDLAPYSALLDIDPDFLYLEEVPQRILETLGKEARFFVILRDPATRAFSHYLMAKFRRREHLSFQKALEAEPERMENPEGAFHHSYIQRGKYVSQLKRYFQFFPRVNFKIFIFEEDFLPDRGQFIKAMCDFMEVPTYPDMPLSLKRNPSRRMRYQWLDQVARGDDSTGLGRWMAVILPKLLWKKIKYKLYIWNTTQKGIEQLSDSERVAINDQYFKAEIKELESLIGRDLSVWRNPKPTT